MNATGWRVSSAFIVVCLVVQLRIIIKKLATLLEELRQHPRTGTGQVEMMKHQQGREVWSRRITRGHRLVYTIEDMIVQVQVISVFGHYDK